MIYIKRIYDTRQNRDGFRILIDRLWPRGISREKAHIDLWMREIAPSDELRKWFAHDPDKWNEFNNKYKEELKRKMNMVEQIRELENGKGIITLLYAAKDEELNNAIILQGILQS